MFISENVKLTFDFLLFSFLYSWIALILNQDAIDLIVVVFGAVSGALVLSYFKRERDRREIFLKSGCAAVCGLVAGAVVTKRWEIDAIQYKFAVYFLSGLCSLFFIKALLNFAEQKASDILITIIRRIFTIENVGTSGKETRLEPTGEVTKTTVLVTKDDKTEITDKTINGKEKETL